MQYLSETDNTVYEDVTTLSGNSLAVVESAIPHIKELYSRITASLNTWTQFFQIVYFGGGVCVEYQDNFYFLKNICTDPSGHFCTISVFGSDLVFKIPFCQEIELQSKIEGITYPSSKMHMTSFFDSDVQIDVAGITVKTYEKNNMHFVSCGDVTVAADLYAVSDTVFEVEMVSNNQHLVFSPIDMKYNAAVCKIPEHCNLRLDCENNIAVELNNEVFRFNQINLAGSELKLEYTTYANPQLIKTITWRV